MSKGIDPTKERRNQKLLALVSVGCLVIVIGSALPRIAKNAQESNRDEAASKTISKEGNSKADAPVDDLPSVISLLTRLGIGTVVVCCLGGAFAYWFSKRMRTKPVAQSGPMQILGKMPVGRGIVFLVQTGEQKMLAAIDAGGLKSLAMLPVSLLEEPATAPVDQAPHTIITERIAVTRDGRVISI